ncbi:MAG: prepilin-type N-terminal cleavage/methylation domain-containing protein [Candidatus Muiribacteriota bacterium]|jgi:general secretion pathway protein G
MKLSKKGFSLIELLISLIIIAIIASVAFPVSRISYVREKEGDLKYNLRQVRDGIDRYFQHHGFYPESLKDLTDGNFLRRIPSEPFGGVWEYRNSSGGLWEEFEDYGNEYKAKPGDDIYDIRTNVTTLSITGEPYSEW